MKIKVNNEVMEHDGVSITVCELLNLRNVKPNGTAVAVNDRLISRDRWQTFQIKNNDDITIISAAFGG